MGYTIQTLENGINIGHIDENGYKKSIMYNPNKRINNVLQPFDTKEELEIYCQQICDEYKLLEPFIEEEIEETINNSEERPYCDPYDFYLKFSNEERKNILNEKKVDPIIEDFLLQLSMGSLKHVYKDDIKLLAGMDYLVYKSLISLERKNEIIESIGV